MDTILIRPSFFSIQVATHCLVLGIWYLFASSASPTQETTYTANLAYLGYYLLLGINKQQSTLSSKSNDFSSCLHSQLLLLLVLLQHIHLLQQQLHCFNILWFKLQQFHHQKHPTLRQFTIHCYRFLLILIHHPLVSFH